MVHQIVSRQPVRLSDEDDAQASADSGLIRASAQLAKPQPSMPVRLAKVPGYLPEPLLNLRYDAIAEVPGRT